MAHISIRHCGLSLPVFGSSNQSLKKLAMAAATGGRIASDSGHVPIVHALRDVSLEIGAGARIGLMGRNGSGKTSMLRMLSGIYEPTSGAVRVEGRVTSLIDVTLGMDQEATGYDNIRLRGLILGLSKREIDVLTPQIVDFSGLGSYISMPLRTYSSGMVLRLAFSTVTCIRPEILLMDEWIGVGDAEFVAKAERRLTQFMDTASIIVLASHNQAIINRLCDTCVRLEHGQIIDISPIRKEAA